MDFTVVHLNIDFVYGVVLSAAVFLGGSWCISKVVGIIKK